MNSLRIYNTLARDKQAFVPLRAGEVRMYVCGMTVCMTIVMSGHARVMVVFDIVQRWLQDAPAINVTYVRNITDIEDKIIRRAVEEQRSRIKALTATIHSGHV